MGFLIVKFKNKRVLPVTRYGLNTMALTRVIERRVLGLSLIDKMRNKKIRIITRVFNFLDKLAHLNWQLEGH